MANSELEFPPSRETPASERGARAVVEAEHADTGLGELDDFVSLAAADQAQLERDIAAIERASAALRNADPALESWSLQQTAPLHKPRPVWLLIGVLWLSTALATLGAVFAISALVG